MCHLESSSWKQFEKLIAAIKALEHRNAEVTWNEHIDGRQFDVTIRSSQPSGDHLTLIECKKLSSNMNVKEVEAFVTKSRDANANRAMMITNTGFQPGAKKVAKTHGIELIVVSEERAIPDFFFEEGFLPVVDIRQVSILPSDGTATIDLPRDSHTLHRELTDATIRTHHGQYTLKQLLDIAGPTLMQQGSPEERHLPLYLYDLAEAKIGACSNWCRISALFVRYRLSVLRRLKYPGLSPVTLQLGYRFADALSGDSKYIHGFYVPHGLNTELKPGHFYEHPALRNYFSCEAVDDDKVKLILLKSEQHPLNLQATMTGRTIEQARYLVEVESKETLKELAALRRRYLKLDDTETRGNHPHAKR